MIEKTDGGRTVSGTNGIAHTRWATHGEVEKYNDYQKNKFLVKGGLLCLWQIQPNRNSISFDEWVELDIKYIETRLLWLDSKIIFKGAWMVLFDHSGE